MKTATKLAVVAVAYGVVEFLLFALRLVGNYAILALPTLIDILANAIIIRAALPAGMRPATKGVLAFALAIFATLLSMAIWTTVTFSTFGT